MMDRFAQMGRELADLAGILILVLAVVAWVAYELGKARPR